MFTFANSHRREIRRVCLLLTRGDERNIAELLSCAREQDEVGDISLSNVSSALKAIDAQKVNAQLDCTQRVLDGRAC